MILTLQEMGARPRGLNLYDTFEGMTEPTELDTSAIEGSALASWTRRYKERFRRMEQLAADAGVDLAQADAARVRELWDRAAS